MSIEGLSRKRSGSIVSKHFESRCFIKTYCKELSHQSSEAFPFPGAGFGEREGLAKSAAYGRNEAHCALSHRLAQTSCVCGCCQSQSSPTQDSSDDQSESCSKDRISQEFEGEWQKMEPKMQDNCSCCGRSWSPSWASAACTGCSCSKGGVRCWRSHQPEEWREEGGQAWEEGGQAWGEDWVQPSGDSLWTRWCGRERIFCCCRAHPCARDCTGYGSTTGTLCLCVGMYHWPTKDHQTLMPNVYLRVGSFEDVTTTQLLQVFGSSSRSIVKYCECNLHK